LQSNTNFKKSSKIQQKGEENEIIIIIIVIFKKRDKERKPEKSTNLEIELDWVKIFAIGCGDSRWRYQGV